MARDIKWAVKEAEEQGAIHRISVEDSTKKEITSSAKKTTASGRKTTSQTFTISAQEKKLINA